MNPTELTPWAEIFGNIQLYHYVQVQKSLIAWIMKITPPKGRIIEVGIGTGWTSILLSQFGYMVIGVDVIHEQIEMATFYGKLLVPENPPRFFQQNLFKLPSFDTRDKFDVGFSDGLFEHFNDKQVISGLQIMKANCRRVIMDVPSWKYRYAEIQRGDEIYRTNRQWRRLICQAGYRIKHTYGSLANGPRWLKDWIPQILGRRLAPYFSTKVGFVL